MLRGSGTTSGTADVAITVGTTGNTLTDPTASARYTGREDLTALIEVSPRIFGHGARPSHARASAADLPA